MGEFVELIRTATRVLVTPVGGVVWVATVAMLLMFVGSYLTQRGR